MEQGSPDSFTAKIGQDPGFLVQNKKTTVTFLASRDYLSPYIIPASSYTNIILFSCRNNSLFSPGFMLSGLMFFL